MTALTRRLAAAGAGLAALAVTAAAAGTPTALAAPAGHSAHMAPATAGAPLARYVGRADVSPNVHFGCQDTEGCYSPAQVRAAYGFDKLNVDGTGRTIVILEAFSNPTLERDLGLFNGLFGLPDADLQVVPMPGVPAFDYADDNQVGWSGEIALDVEWAHAVAPGAKLVLVEAKSNDDADLNAALAYAVRNNFGDVISMSFGEGETCMDPALVASQHQLFSEATSKGITLLASSGDQGSAQPDCTVEDAYFKSASTPASDPFVTAVGGTRLHADSDGVYASEDAWNEPVFDSGTGGGFSTLYGTPHYQKRLGLTSRGVPDVAYNAAIIGGVLAVWTAESDGVPRVYRFGGTSAGAPQWAGLVADAAQLKGDRIGFLNDRLYGWASSRTLAGRLFHDVTAGDNAFEDIDGYAAGSGWDAATGVGSPRADTLVPALAGR